MHCPQLKDLPKPPSLKTGWPWSEEVSQATDMMGDDQPWPCISIVTPSYNQGKFIEETIRSVLLQGYPNLEYIVMDGGSTDCSVEIIKKYEAWLTYWVSEPDHGQSHAINKGFEHAHGEILAWINSDDLYAPGAFRKIGQAVKDIRGSGSSWEGWLTGECLYWNVGTDEKVPLLPEAPPEEPIQLLRWRCPQRSSFWSKSCWDRVGPVSEDLHFAFDTEFFLRLVFSGYRPVLLPDVLALGRIHPECKTHRQKDSWGPEMSVVYDRLADFLQPAERVRVRRAVRADLARVRYRESRMRNRWLAAIAAGSKILWYSPPWNRQEGLPI
jgi:glycosyltransferase involved in cell wall biosynthesis